MAARSASPREPGDATLRFMPDEVLLKVIGLQDAETQTVRLCS